MNLQKIIATLGLEVFTPQVNPDKNVTGGYCGDLLSDVMGHAPANAIWLTVQTHVNIVAVASLKDISAILLVRGQKPEQDTLDRCTSEGIMLLGSANNAFELAGILTKILEEK